MTTETETPPTEQPKCPHQIPVGPIAGMDIVKCQLVSDVLGWGHGFPTTMCEQCSRSADDEIVKGHIIAAARTRLMSGLNPEFPAEQEELASPDHAVALLVQFGVDKRQIVEHMKAATRRGLPEQEAVRLIKKHKLPTKSSG